MTLRLLAVLLAILTLGLSSCIEGDEELWLENDGSGRLEAVYKMPPAIMNRFGGAPKLESRLRDAFGKEPSIRLEKIGHRMEGPQVVFELIADFDDVRDVIALPKKHLRNPEDPDEPSAEESFFGKMKLKLEGLSLVYDRRIDLSPVLPSSARENPGMLGDSTFNYTLHLPARATTHNAAAVSNDGRTLRWSFLLREHTNEPITIHSKLWLPLPWWAWALGGLVIVLLLLAPVRFFRKRMRSAPPAE